MPAFRYFINDPLIVNTNTTLHGDELHHLIKVMRAKTQDTIELVNGCNTLAKAIVKHIDKHSATIFINKTWSKAPPLPLILAQAIPKHPRLDFIIEKGTELGVTQFWLFPSENSEKKEISSLQHQRLEHIAIAAMKQCGRLDLPQILVKEPIKTWQKFEGNCFFGDTHPDAPHLASLPISQKPCLFFIGPEKGFHEKEINILQNTLHAVGVKLHKYILRTDTAALAAITLVSYSLHPHHHLP